MELTSVQSYSVALIAALTIYFSVKRFSYSQKIPPGPWGVPIFGSLIHLNRKNPLHEFATWRKIYGNIFSVSCGDFLLIVIHEYKIICELAKKDEFCGRPNFQSWIMRNKGKKNRGILFSDNVNSWNEQRRFALRNLRDFGFGKGTMETLFIYELQHLTTHLKELVGKPVNLASSFNATVLNSLWTILTGKRFAQNDPLFNQLMEVMNTFLKNLTLISPALFMPWPAKYNLVKPGLWNARAKMVAQQRELINNIIQEHAETFNENEMRDFIDVYLQQMKTSQDVPSFSDEEGIRNLQIVMTDLFVAGVETTSTTILFAVLFFSKFPEVQKKLHEEIDRVIGRDRAPTRDDKTIMVYMEAFCNEVHRKASLLPMSVFHKNTKDTVYDGMLFPEGSVLFFNLHDVHHDKNTWGDPENFRPERFLDETGTKIKKYDELIQFGVGKRACLGEALARDNLFIFITGLLQEFSFELEPSCKNVDINDFRPNFTSSPYPFEVIMTLRS